ncbi:hypothetical protein ABGB12_00485 [Actinocorallia sp. B10E7]|uniref:SHOCT domain-containing protein n=1 Tax=Actinocorallia sp. B10E7 TaxID=3153558 RepID=UPI00325E8FA4
MYWHGDHMNGWGFAFMMIGNLVFWGVVIFAVVMLVRSTARSEQRGQAAPPREHRDPEAILAERFARGEMEAEEYRARLQVLRDHRPDA